MDAGVEAADGPDGRKPGQHKCPARGPSSEIFGLGKDVMGIVAFAAEVLAHRKSNNGCGDEDEIHDYEDGLKLAHDLRKCGSENSVKENAAKEDGIDDAVGRSPIAITCDHNTGWVRKWKGRRGRLAYTEQNISAKP